MANNFRRHWLLFQIDLYNDVYHSRLCEGTDEGPIFIRKVWNIFITLCRYLIDEIHK